MSGRDTFRILNTIKKVPSAGVSPAEVRERIASCIPDPQLRRHALGLLARGIRVAHEANPASWEVSVLRGETVIRLNVGRCALFSLAPGKVSLVAWTPSPSDSLPPALRVLPDVLTTLPELAWLDFEPAALANPGADLLRLFDQAAHLAATRVRATPYARSHSAGAVVAISEELGEQLPQPAFPDTTISDLRREVLRLVESHYPKWEGFRDPRMLEEERTYKLAAAAKAQDLLSREALERLIAAGSYDELVTRISSVASATNLLYLAAPSTGDLSLLYHAELDRAAFARELLEVLHGTGSTYDRLGRWTGWLDSHSLPNKWVLTTYLLFLLHPDRELFVKPTVTKRFLDLVGIDRETSGRIDPDTYQVLVDLAGDLRLLFQDFGPEDMIDVQGLIWVCWVAEQGQSILPGQRAAVRQRIQSLADDPALAEKAHAYEQAREQFRRNWREISTIRDQGQDPTEAVFRLLLPHPSPAASGEPPVWYHPTQKGSKPLYEHAESVGWIASTDRSEVAAALIALVETCQLDPNELDAACAELARRVPKGLASGTLSPVLNALRPDDYALINNASRSLQKELTGKKPLQPIEHYPAGNRTALKLISDLEPVFADLVEVDAHPGDLFDLLAQTEESEPALTGPGSPAGASTGFRYWKIAPGEKAFHWNKCLEGGFISLGWEELGDLKGIDRTEFDRRVQTRVDSEGWKAFGLNQLWAFVTEVRRGDVIIANKGTSEILGVGTVVGDYTFVPDEIHGHRIPVSWTYQTPFPVREDGWRRTLIRLAEPKGQGYLEQARQVEGRVPVPDPPKPPPAPDINPLKSLKVIAEETGLEVNILESWVRAVRRKRQAVFYGPPGTGKTWVAQHIAAHLVGGGNGFVELVQFHPAYAYEDFIQGIRPSVSNGQVTYELTPGRFMDVCSQARRTKGVCVLIIDEINRANLARVFGELMYLLEYRKASVPLAGGETLSVPDNLYLIGTMNTADRSIALVDHALRRRFAFLELRPQYSALRRFHERAATNFDPAGLIAVLERANQHIADPHYELGISFFTRENLAEQIEDIWSMEIVPYLEEYFFDRAEKVAQFRWPKVREEILGE